MRWRRGFEWWQFSGGTWKCGVVERGVYLHWGSLRLQRVMSLGFELGGLESQLSWMIVGFWVISETEYAGSLPRRKSTRRVAACKTGPSESSRSRLGEGSLLLSRSEGVGFRRLKVYDMSSLMDVSFRMVGFSVSMDDVRDLLDRQGDRC